MGWILDNVNLTAQASSAAASRLDSQNEFTGGGAGPRGTFNQNFSFGNSKQDANTDASGASSEMPWYVWLLVALGAVLLLVKLNGKT